MALSRGGPPFKVLRASGQPLSAGRGGRSGLLRTAPVNGLETESRAHGNDMATRLAWDGNFVRYDCPSTPLPQERRLRLRLGRRSVEVLDRGGRLTTSMRGAHGRSISGGVEVTVPWSGLAAPAIMERGDLHGLGTRTGRQTPIRFPISTYQAHADEPAHERELVAQSERPAPRQRGLAPAGRL